MHGEQFTAFVSIYNIGHLKRNFRFLYPLTQIWTAKYGGFVSSIILNIEIYYSDILHEVNGIFKEAYLIWHTQINITCTKHYTTFHSKPTSTTEIESIIKTVKPKNAYGYNEISTKLPKNNCYFDKHLSRLIEVF